MTKDKEQTKSVVYNIRERIFLIRGVYVMLDSDLAELYGVETKVLNQAVKRNKERFPDDLMFTLTNEEFLILRSQNVTSSWGGRRYNPKVFTEQGVYMLATILRSKTATEVTLSIMRTFTKMKNFLATNAIIFQRLDEIEHKQFETDEKINRIFKALESKHVETNQGIFYDGQVFDAYVFVAKLIKSAQKSIILIDNYIDESVLQLFTKRNKNITVTIFTKNITETLKLDLEKYNAQYPEITIKKFTKAHDRFLIIDNKHVYHFGASLKDLGKKWFAFSKMDIKAMEMIANIKKESDDMNM